jgi:GntR family transcriptional regulator
VAESSKHQQVYRALLEMASHLPTDSELPTERELGALLSVSRSTVRRALQELETEQRVYRVQGRGTFVAGPKIDQVLELTGQFGDMRLHGMPLRWKLVDVNRLVADPDAAAKLAVAVGAEVVRIERLRLVDGDPIALEVLYVDAQRFDDLMPDLDEENSFYQLLHRRYGIDLATAEETIEVVVAGEREVALLGTDFGAPMLMLARRTLDTDGRPIEYVQSFYRGDRVRFRAYLDQRDPVGSPRRPTFRPGHERDAAALARVFVAAWRGGYRGIVPDSVIDALDVEEVAEWLRVQLASSRQVAIAAVAEEGAIVGFIRVGDDPDDARRGQVFSLYVTPEAGGNGIGRELLKRGLDALASRGQHEVTLWVFADNGPARHLYASRGFAPDGTHRVEAQFMTEEIRMSRVDPRAEATRGAARSRRGGTRPL